MGIIHLIPIVVYKLFGFFQYAFIAYSVLWFG
jgi:hypothetical protein